MRASGGSRDVERKHRARDERRGPRYDAQSIAQFKRAQRRGKDAAAALEEALDFLRLAMRQAAADPGMPPEQRREQVGRIAAALAKVADPKRMIEELGADLRAAHEALASVRDARGGHAPQEPARDPSGNPPPDLQ